MSKTLKTAMEKTIVIHWWNMGTKTLDFKGKCEDYLKRNDFKVALKRGRIKIDFSTSSSTATVTQRANNDQDAYVAIVEAIRLFLTMMGDKAKLTTPYREYRLNWR